MALKFHHFRRTTGRRGREWGEGNTAGTFPKLCKSAQRGLRACVVKGPRSRGLCRPEEGGNEWLLVKREDSVCSACAPAVSLGFPLPGVVAPVGPRKPAHPALGEGQRLGILAPSQRLEMPHTFCGGIARDCRTRCPGAPHHWCSAPGPPIHILGTVAKNWVVLKEMPRVRTK